MAAVINIKLLTAVGERQLVYSRQKQREDAQIAG